MNLLKPSRPAIKLSCFAILAGLCNLTATAIAHSGATGIVKDRMEMFSQSKANMKAIRGHLAAGDLQAVTPLALHIRNWAEKMPDYFPEGSAGSPSEAAPAIWADFAGFRAAAMASYAAADDLASASRAGDAEATVAAFKATAASCKSCHKTYRLD
jgi:cytochrome c556